MSTETLFEIIVPISKPGIATVALLNALAFWNEWFISMLYIRKTELYPLQYLLMDIQRKADFLKKNASLLGPEGGKAVKRFAYGFPAYGIGGYDSRFPLRARILSSQQYIVCGLDNRFS